MARAIILTYHAVEAGPSPLCVDPALFEAHADVIAETGIRCVTVRELADGLQVAARESLIAITFDDGFASAADVAAPLLLERGLIATVFCVAGHLGGANDWPSARLNGYRSRLADAAALSELAARGFEIGSHGSDHEPLAGASEGLLRREVIDSRGTLEDAVGTRVTSYAYPYGASPSTRGRTLVIGTYDAACTMSLQRVQTVSHPHALPRVDAHYLRRPELLRRVLAGELDMYLRARRLAAGARRALARDYMRPTEARRSLSE